MILLDRVRGGERATAILRRPGMKDRVIEPHWWDGLALKVLWVLGAVAMVPVILPIVIVRMIFRRKK